MPSLPCRQCCAIAAMPLGLGLACESKFRTLPLWLVSSHITPLLLSLLVHAPAAVCVLACAALSAPASHLPDFSRPIPVRLATPLPFHLCVLAVTCAGRQWSGKPCLGPLPQSWWSLATRLCPSTTGGGLGTSKGLGRGGCSGSVLGVYGVIENWHRNLPCINDVRRQPP